MAMNRVAILIISIIIAQPLTAATSEQRPQSYFKKTYQQVNNYVKEHPTATAAALIAMGIATSTLYYMLKPPQPLGERPSRNDGRSAPRSDGGTHPRAPVDLAPAASTAVLGAEAVALLSQPSAMDINARDGNGRTALTRAVRSGDVQAVRSLLAKGAKANKADGDGVTALMAASRDGRVEIVRLLLVEPNIKIDAKDFDGRTALGYAALNDHVEILILLREEEANLIPRDNDGRTPLMYAAIFGYLDVVETLLRLPQSPHPVSWSFAAEMFFRRMQQAARDINATDRSGNTALMLAATHGHREILRFLLNQGASIDAVNRDGHNALMVAAYWDKEGSVIELLRARMPVNAVSNKGDTALSVALKAGSAHATRALILAGADLTKLNTVQMRQALAHFEPYAREMMAARVAAHNQNDALRASNGQFAPSLAVLAAVIGDTETLREMASTPEGRDLLTISDRVTFEMTPLAAAIYTGQDGVVDLLLDTHFTHDDADLVNPRRYQPFVPSTDTQTPLIVAVRTGRMDLVRRLIVAGAHALDTYQRKTAADYCPDIEMARLIKVAQSMDRANPKLTLECKQAAELAPLHLQAKVLQHLIYYRLGILIDVSWLQENFSGHFYGLPLSALLDVAQGANRVHARQGVPRLPLKPLVARAQQLREDIKNHSNFRRQLQALEDSDLHKLDKRLLTLLARHVAHEFGNQEVELSTAEKEQAELFWKQID